MSTFHYGFGNSKNKWKAINKLLDNCEYMNEKIEKQEEQFEAACRLLGIAFSPGDWGDAYYAVRKDGDKK